MQRVLKKIEEISGQKPLPLKTDKAEKCIVYKFWQSSAYTYRLEIRVIDFTLAGAEATSAAIIKGICNFGDTNKIQGIPSIVLNGGGVLEDENTNTIQRLLYFDLIIKG